MENVHQVTKAIAALNLQKICEGIKPSIMKLGEGFAVTRTVIQIIQEDPEEHYRRDVLEMFERIFERMKLLELNVLKEIKFQEFGRLCWLLDSMTDHLKVMLTTYSDDELIPHLTSFIQNLMSKNFESAFINALNDNVLHSKSFLELFSEEVYQRHEDDKIDSLPPHKMANDFGLYLLELVCKANNILKFCYRLRNELDGSWEHRDIDFVFHRRQFAVEKLQKFMENLFPKVEEFSFFHKVLTKVEITPQVNVLKLSTQKVMVQRGVDFVITGTRFIQRKGIFYLQIRSAKLLPFGLVDEITSKWEPIGVSETYESFENICTCFFEDDFDDFVLKGVQIEKKPVRLANRTVFVPNLILHRRKFNLIDGTLMKTENQLKTSLIDDEEVQYFSQYCLKSKRKIMDRKGIFQVSKREYFEGEFLPSHQLFRNIRIDADDVVLNVPISSINFMAANNVIKPYVKSINLSSNWNGKTEKVREGSVSPSKISFLIHKFEDNPKLREGSVSPSNKISALINKFEDTLIFRKVDSS